MFKYIAIACLLGVAAGVPHGYATVEHDAYPRYGFNYAVSDPHTGDYKAQSEHRDGGVVKGSYSVAEPDGTLRVVDYAADPVSGFNAHVKRLGAAHHPHHVIAPIVKAPVIAPIAVAPAYSTALAGVGAWGHGAWGHGAWGGLGHGAWGGIGHGAIGHGALGHGALGHGALGHGSWGLGAYSDLGAHSGWLGGHGHGHGWKY